MLSDQGYYVKTVVENPRRPAQARRRVWDISGRRYNGVHPISFHIGLTGDEIEGQKPQAAGRPQSPAQRLGHLCERRHGAGHRRSRRSCGTASGPPCPLLESSDAAPSEPTEPIDAASTEVVRMRHAALTLRERIHAAAGRTAG
jgi:hypothetical protein